MPRRELVLSQPRSITAAATPGTGLSLKVDPKASRKDKNLRAGADWQRAGWGFYDVIAEYRQAATVMGALLSRAKLVVYEKGKPTKNKIALAALAEFMGGPEGQTKLLRLHGVHMTVAGEFYVFSPAIVKGQPLAGDWIIASATRVKRTGGVWEANGEKLAGQRLVIQIRRQHPENPNAADAPTLAVLPVLNELLQLTKRVAAQIDSRLTGAGILVLPSEMEFPSVGTQINHGDPVGLVNALQAGDAQGFAELLKQTARIAVQNPESAEAMLPIIATVPAEHMDKLPDKPISFWTELDKAAPGLREESITRIARGMDIPAEVLLGNAGSNHWNAWLSDENTVKIHGEPTLEILTSAITVGYLRLALADEPGIDPADFSVGADTSQMRLRPNRSKEALELNDRLIMSDAATLRENGFTEEDVMDAEGLRIALLRKMAGGSTTPEIVAIAARMLGVELPELTDNRPPAEARPTPSLVEHPVRDLPQIEDSAAADLNALTFVAEQIVDAALKRAGNRTKTRLRMKELPTEANRLYMALKIEGNELDDALEGAWETCSLADYGVSAKDFARALDMYTRSLIMTQREPSRPGIRAVLKLLLSRDAA